jgi:hypothetical protein
LIHGHTFQPRDLIAGHLALDLVNTVTARNAEPVDWLTGYPRLLQWASLTGEFDPGTLGRAALAPTPRCRGGRAARHPELREALHDVTSAIIRNGPPAPADCGALNGPEGRCQGCQAYFRSRKRAGAAHGRDIRARVPQPRTGPALSRATPGPAARAHPHLPGSALRLAVHRPLQRRPATLVRHGNLR